jgi:hypothetical protein
MLTGLFVAALLLFSSNAAFAQSDFDPEKEFFGGAKVLSINDNIVQCELDLTADISIANVKRTIEVGDLLYTSGQIVSSTNFKSLLQAETVTVAKTRDVRFSGNISGVSATGLNIVGQPIVINDRTEINGAVTLLDGQAAFVWAEFKDGVFTAYKISVLEKAPDLEIGILSRVTNIEGTKLSLIGDFSVIVTPEQLQALQKTFVGVGSPISVVLNQSLRSKKIKKRQILTVFETNGATFSKTIGGKPQAIDFTNKSITINNLTLTVSPETTIPLITNDGLKLLKFSDINLNDYDFVVAEYDDRNTIMSGLHFNKKP